VSKALFTGFRWFLDVSTAMLDSRGKPRRDLFKWDGLHPNAECYALWTSIIRPVLMERPCRESFHVPVTFDR
jgi:hypothetical protein